MESNPYSPPRADLTAAADGEPHYAGFWLRVAAALIDSALWIAISLPLLVLAYGWDYFNNTDLVAGTLDLLLSWLLPIAVVILFWVYRSATPGKMAFGAKIVDVETGDPPTVGQCVGRYAAYIVSMLPLGLGLFWVAVDRRKQGWHDKLAGTAVIRERRVARTFPDRK